MRGNPTKFKKLDDAVLYEYLYQSGVREEDIPRKRKSRIALCEKVRYHFRTHPLRTGIFRADSAKEKVKA